MSGPDAQTVTEQLLRTYLDAPKFRFLRRRRVGSGGVAMLRAAGLDKHRAEAVNTMARRTADAWRAADEPVNDADVAETAARLLL